MKLLKKIYFKIVMDTPGLEKEHIIEMTGEKKRKTTTFKTKADDTIKLSIYQTIDGAHLKIEYEREIDKCSTRRTITRAEGRWEKVIELPNEFRGFNKYEIALGGISIIKIWTRELFN